MLKVKKRGQLQSFAIYVPVFRGNFFGGFQNVRHLLKQIKFDSFANRQKLGNRPSNSF